MDRHEIGWMIAVSRGAGMMIGMVAGGLIADRLAKRARAGALTVIILSFVLAAVPTIATYFVTSANTAFALSALSGLLVSFAIGPEIATLQSNVPASQRATASALSGLVSGIIGVGGGPLIVGLLSDALAGYGPDSLRHALQILTIVMLPIAIGAYALARRALLQRTI